MKYNVLKITAFLMLTLCYSCTEPIPGCTDENAYNYSPNANTDDGSCISIVLGCTDKEALNFNEDANTDDGSCIEGIKGCTDEEAINFNLNANLDDGNCKYNPLTTIEGTKKCLLDNNGDWCYPSCDDPSSSIKFLSDGTWSFATDWFGGMHTRGTWSVTTAAEVNQKTTHANSLGVLHNINYCPTNEPLPNDKVMKLTDYNKLMNGSTPYYRANNVLDIPYIKKETINIQSYNQNTNNIENGNKKNGKINVDNLNFRSSPDFSDNIIEKLEIGTLVEILGVEKKSFKNVTHCLLIDDHNILCNNEQLKLNKNKVLDIVDDLNEKIVCKVSFDEFDCEFTIETNKVELIDYQNWSKIKVKNQIGYVYERFITVN